MTKRTIGIVGCGAIGTALAGYVVKGLKQYVDNIFAYDSDAAKTAALAGTVKEAVISESMDEVFAGSGLVIESACAQIVPEFLEKAVHNGKDAMVMSVGGVLGREDLISAMKKKGLVLILPSGAIGGIDAVKASRIAGIKSVTLTTRKSPLSLRGAPYLSEKGIDVDKIKVETVIFEGTAGEAMKGFPKNINVSALLSIAGIGKEKTKVKIITSPEYTKNIHEVEVESGAGRFFSRTENVPFPENPKTSYLAALAAMASLEGYFGTIRVGT